MRVFARGRPVSRPAYLSRRGLIAGSLAALGLLSTGEWVRRQLSADREPEARYFTDVGEVRTILLADGSSIGLNTKSEIFVRYERTRREIQLAGGEAFFQVAHDPTRPFDVRAGELTVRAVGTAFAIHTANSRHPTNVTVTEGVVDVVRARTQMSGARTAKRLVANQGAIVRDTGPVEVRSVPEAETARRLAWRSGMVVFSGESLGEAVAEMNRYCRKQIVIGDTDLVSRPIVGVFFIANTESFIAAVERTLGVQAFSDGDGVVLRRPD